MNKNFYFSLPERSLDSNTWSDLLLFPLGKTNLIKINVIPQSQYFFHVVPVLSSGWCVYMWGEWLERIFRKMLSGKERDHSSDQWNFHRKENWSDLTLSARNLTSGTSYILLATLVNKLIWKNIIGKNNFVKPQKQNLACNFKLNTYFYKSILTFDHDRS